MINLYRVQIIEQPEWEERICFDTHKYGPDEGERYEVVDHCPVGWEASEDYILHFHTDRWIEPATEKLWRSRSSAASRRDLLEAAGYKAIVQKSAPVEWPTEGQTSVNTSEIRQVTDAIKVLKRAGLINSADDLIN